MRLLFSLLFLCSLKPFAEAQILVKDIYPGPVSAMQMPLGHIGDKLFFYGTNNTNGTELWITQGDSSNTKLVKDVNGLSNSSIISQEFHITDSLIFFYPTESSTTTGFCLYRSDGTESGTFRLYKLQSTLVPRKAFFEYTSVNNKFLFINNTANNTKEIWVSDGTVAGTHILKDSKSGESPLEPLNLISIGNKAYFYAGDQNHGHELWCTDGTDAGTYLVKDIFQGPVSSIVNTSNGPNMLAFKDKVYFSAISNLKIGYELFVSDGTDSGTHLVKDLYLGDYNNSYPKVKVACDEFMLVIANTDSGRMVMWRSDGTDTGTRIVYDPKEFLFSTTSRFASSNLGSSVVFSFFTSDFGQELWISDGTMSGTHLLIDVAPGVSTGFNGNLVQKGKDTYFVGNNNNFGRELWKIDGNTLETQLFADLLPGVSTTGFSSIEIVGDYLYTDLMIDNNVIGRELYKIPLWNTTKVETIDHLKTRFYPNPVSKKGHLQATQTVSTINIYNSLGDCLGQLEITDAGIALPDSLSAGLYLLTYEINGQIQKTWIQVTD